MSPLPRVPTLCLGFFSGILLAISYRAPGFWPVSFVALVPLFYAIFYAQKKRDAFFAGTLAGVITTGASVIWFFASLPLPAFLGVFDPLPPILFALISFAEVSIAMGLIIGLFALIARLLTPTKTQDLLALPLLYAAAEYLRMFAFAVITYSPQVHNPVFFSAGMIGYPLMDSDSWRQSALLGMFFVGFLVAFINALFFIALERVKGTRRTLTLGILILALILFSYAPIVQLRSYALKPPAATARVAILSLPESEFQDAAFTTTLSNLVSTSAKEGADIILLPEGSHLFHPFGVYAPEDVLPERSRAVVVDSGTFTSVSGGRLNRAIAQSLSGGVSIRDKYIFTPEGEYLPIISRALIRWGGGRKALDYFDISRSFTQGSGGNALSLGPVRASVLFCLEVMFPEFGKTLAAEEKTNLLLVASSHVWLHQSPALETDALRFAEAQAVSAGRPLAESASGGTAYVLDRYGRVQKRIGVDGETTYAVIPVSLPAF